MQAELLLDEVEEVEVGFMHGHDEIPVLHRLFNTRQRPPTQLYERRIDHVHEAVGHERTLPALALSCNSGPRWGYSAHARW